MTGNEKYWKNRATQRMFEHMQLAEDTADQIAQLYLKASGYLSAQMRQIFERYMTKHKLTEQEARRLISMLQDPASLQEMLRKLKSGDFAEKTREELLMELEAPAYQARIERLQQLQNQIDLIMRQVYQQEKDFSTAYYVDLANESYYRSVFDIQQRAGVGFSFAHVSRKQIDRVVNSKWSGKNYSSRIWGNTKALAQSLKEELLISLVTGKTEREVADILANKFAQGASTARRLVRTESCFLSNQMEMESYKECGIEKYRYVATLDLRTSKICASLDGKLFPVSEQQPGKNCPPMHPWCRSTTIAHISDEAFANMKRRAFNPETGRSELVPATMTYREWYEKYVTGKPKAEAEEKKIKNRSSDQKQYQEYKKVLGDEMPETFAKFQEMKYNDSDKWDELKAEYRIVNQYELVSGRLSAPDICRIDEKFQLERLNFNSKFRSQGNIAIAEFEGKDYIAHSKVKNELSPGFKNYKGKMSFAFEIQDRCFITKVIPEKVGWDRKVDSEAKIFEYINTIANGSEQTLNLMSNYPMCDSCIGVFRQFQEKHQNIHVNIIQRKVRSGGKN